MARPIASETGLVGRQPELGMLRDGLAAAVAGHGGLFLLTGEPGIGKTRLADEVAGVARADGATILWGRCWEGDGAPAFHPWRRIIRSYAETADAESLRRDLGGAAADVAQLVPEIGARLGDPASGTALDPEQARFRLFDGVTTLLRAASRRHPLLILFDDLHWADPPSLLLLRFLARDLRNARLLVVGTTRDLELEQDRTRAGIVAEIAREGTRIPLHGLDRAAVAALMARAAGVPPSAELVAAVHARTDGNPFFLGEVVRFLRPDGRFDASLRGKIPPGVRETIRRRLERLSPACHRLLAAAAVIGREFDVDLLGRAANASMEEVWTLLDEARDAHLVGDAPASEGRLRFTHALVQETLYDEIPGAERPQRHRAVGRALEAASTMGGPRLAELAHHFLRAAPLDEPTRARAAEYAERAGAEAAVLLAFEDAAAHYEHALRLLGEDDPSERVCRLLLARGDAEMRAGTRRRARETYLRAVATARTLGRPDLLAQAVLGYGRRLEIALQLDASLLGLIEEALAALGPSDDRLRALLLARSAVVLYGGHEVERARARCAEAVGMAERLADPATLTGVLASQQVVLWGPDALDERAAVAERITRLAIETGNRDAELAGRLGSLTSALERGDLGTVERETEAYGRLARELRQPHYLWQVPSLRAMRALMEGRVADAERAVEEARALAEEIQSPNIRIRSLAQLHQLRRAQGRLAEVVGEYARALEWYPLPALRALLAGLYADLGRLDDARTAFEQFATGGFGAIARAGYWLPAMVGLAEVCAALGDAPRAAELYSLLLPYAAHVVVVNRGDGCEGAVSRYLGLLAATMGRAGEADRHFTEAAALNARLGARLLVAHTERDHSAMLLRCGEDGDAERARSLAARALATYRTLDLAHYVARMEHTTEDAGPAVPNVFRREGDVWVLGFDGRAARLRDAKGLRYLAQLVRHPGREFHVVDLAGAADVREADATPTPDGQARSAYRQRLADLREQLEEAEGFNDVGRATRLREEIDAIAVELAGVYGLRGARVRGGAERVRKAVTKCIRDQIAKVEGLNSVLGRHLANAVRTGTFCAYRPEKPVDWEL
jgi:tetratricopeptide (TPR) repeat protein